MTIGDRVVVLESEHRGTIIATTHEGQILVERDDLGDDWPAIPYDPFELEVCGAASR